jgi:hypothetical protein
MALKSELQSNRTTVKRIVAALLLLPGLLTAETYREFLSHLDASRPESLCLASERFEWQFGDPARGGQPVALFALWAFYDKAVRVNGETVEHLAAGTSDEEAASILAALRTDHAESALRAVGKKVPQVWRRAEQWLRCGYVIMADWDDTIRLDPDPRFLVRFADHLRPDCRAYIELYLRESPVWLDYDGALAIPWERLRSRIRRWERFRAEHMDVPELAAHMNGVIKEMFQYYLCGLDNSEVFDDAGRLIPDLRDSYARFLLLNKDSAEYGLVEQTVKTLRRKQWKLDRDLFQLYKSHGYETERIEPRLPRAGR